MGSKVEKKVKRAGKAVTTFGASEAYEGTVGKQKDQARKEAAQQAELIARQEQKENLALAESEDAIARRKKVAVAGGRRSLLGSGYGVSLLRRQS